MSRELYFENAAVTYPKPEDVYCAMDEASRTLWGDADPEGTEMQRRVYARLQEIKRQTLDYTGAAPGATLAFSSCISVVAHQVIGGISWKERDVVYVAPYLCRTFVETLRMYREEYGFRMEEIPVEQETHATDLGLLERRFAECPPTHLFMSQISDVNGYVLPVRELCELARRYQAVTILDISLSCGLLPLRLRELPVDLAVFAGYRSMYGPYGVSGLINQTGIPIRPIDYGETESCNLVDVCGLGGGLDYLEECEDLCADIQDLTWYLAKRLSELPQVTLYLPPDSKTHICVTAFRVEGLRAKELAGELLYRYHITVGVVDAKELPKNWRYPTYGIVRASVGLFTSREDVDYLVRAIREVLLR